MPDEVIKLLTIPALEEATFYPVPMNEAIKVI